MGQQLVARLIRDYAHGCDLTCVLVQSQQAGVLSWRNRVVRLVRHAENSEVAKRPFSGDRPSIDETSPRLLGCGPSPTPTNRVTDRRPDPSTEATRHFVFRLFAWRLTDRSHRDDTSGAPRPLQQHSPACRCCAASREPARSDLDELVQRICPACRTYESTSK